MAALFPTGLETTPSSDLRRAAASPREVGIRLFATGLAMSAALLLAGWILLASASGLQPGDPLPGARPEGVNAPPYPAPPGQPGAAKLPQDWTWERPAIRFDGMYRQPR